MIVKTPKPKKAGKEHNGVSNRHPKAAEFGVSGKPPASTGKAVPKKENKFSGFAPWKIILATILIGLAGYFYLTHLFTTQEVYQEVRQLEQEHETARRMYEEQRLIYDRMTGPAQIYNRAGELGFIHGGANDPVIEID